MQSKNFPFKLLQEKKAWLKVSFRYGTNTGIWFKRWHCFNFRRNVVCKVLHCTKCSAKPCGVCGNCKYPSRKKKCILRYRTLWHLNTCLNVLILLFLELQIHVFQKGKIRKKNLKFSTDTAIIPTPKQRWAILISINFSSFLRFRVLLEL